MLVNRAKDRIQKLNRTETMVIGPTEASIGKINDVYRYIFYVKNRDYQVLVALKDDLEHFINKMQWNTDSVQFDFDPINNY